MNVRRYATIALTALAPLTAPAQSTSASAALAFAAIRDDYDVGGGAAVVHDLTEDIAIYVGAEYVGFEDESGYRDEFFFSKTVRDVQGFEIQFGYLHRVLRGDNASLQIGPAIGLEDIEGDERFSFGGEFGSGSSSTEIDYELGLNAYLQALLRIRAFERVELFASLALGYRSAREIDYGDGGVIPLAERSDIASSSPVDFSFNDDSDTFLRTALGIVIPF